MRKYIVFFTMIILFSCSEYKGDRDSLSYDSVEIIFDGYGDDCYTYGDLKILITNPIEVKKLNHLKNQSKTKWIKWIIIDSFVIEYEILLYFSNSKTEDKLLVRILKNEGFSATIQYGLGTIFDGTYKNEELADYVESLIKLEEIRKYKGTLTQEKYNRLIKKDGY